MSASVGIAEAVSTQRQSEAHLRLQSAALEAAANAILITDRAGNAIWANPAFTQLTGYSITEVLGQNVRFLKSGQQDQSFYQNLWQTVLAGRVWQAEMVNRRKDGSLYPEENTITPVRDQRGEITHFIAVKQDLTERKRAEVQLATLAQAVESTSEPIAITDLQDRFTFVNRAFQQTYGYTEADILGRTADVVYSPTNPPDLLAEILAQTRRGGWRGEVVGRRKDGTDVPVFLSTSRIKSKTGEVIGLMAVAQDITERKRLEREVMEISASERRRLGHDLHDGLGQCLAGIAYRVQALEQSLASAGVPHALEAKLVAALLRNAITQTRSLARGLDPVGIENIGLVAALQVLAAETEAVFNLTCRFQCADPTLRMTTLRVDPLTALPLYRIVQEAVHNAITHGEARQITIELAMDNDHLCLRIQDDGIGFAGGTGNPTGMGLRVMQYRARSIEARLEINSEINHGTEIRCLLPRAVCFPAAPDAGTGA